jgi:hypothetical protein
VRNVGQWLAKAWQRDWMRDSLFVHLVANTGGWIELVGDALLVGDMAHDVLGRRSTVCTRSGLVFEPWWFAEDVRRFLADKLDGYVLPPEELVHRHVLGSMAEVARELVPQLPRLDGPGGGDRDTPDALEEISRRLAVARTDGVLRMTGELRDGFERTRELLDVVDRAARESVDRPVPPDRSTTGGRSRAAKAAPAKAAKAGRRRPT